MDAQGIQALEDGDKFEQESYTDSQTISISGFYSIVKRCFDLIFSAIGLLALFPLLCIISLLIVITSKGPAIYKQIRIGKHGKTFTIYKFRTMIDGAENLTKYLTEEQYKYYLQNRKLKDDPRITKIGKYLRATSLDELPQLINVFIGDMSLVGPRPMLPEEALQYGNSIEKYRLVRPGITGLWQVSARHDTRMCARAELDMQYISHFSFKEDRKILIITLRVVITQKGAM